MNDVRFLTHLRLGLSAGLLAGAFVGLGEAFSILARTGSSRFGVLAYACLLYGVLGLAGGGCAGVAAAVALRRAASSWVFSFVAVFAPLGTVITLFLLRRGFFREQMPPPSVLLGVLLAFGLVGLFCWFVCRPLLEKSALRFLLAPVGSPVAFALILAFTGLASLVSAPSGDAASAFAERDSRPDLEQAGPVLLIMVDTLRADHVAAYGEMEIETPAMDRLAEEGVLYENAYAQASWTRASIASLLTSMYPSGHQAFRKADRLPGEIDTLPEILQGMGYFTAARANNINVTEAQNFDQGYDDFVYLRPDYPLWADEMSFQLTMYSVLRLITERYFNEYKEVSLYYRDGPEVTAAAEAFYEEHGSARSFMFLHYMDPHDPYFRHPYDGWGYARVDHPNPDPSEAPELLEVYRGEVEFFDEALGELFSFLDERGLWDDMTIMLTSDHGEEFFEHGGWWHGITLYEEQVRVPLMVKWSRYHQDALREAAELKQVEEESAAWWALLEASQAAGEEPPEDFDPEALPPVPTPWAGGREAEVVRIVDVAPTLVTVNGGAVPEEWRGVSLTEPLDERAPSERVAYSEEDFEGNILHSIRDESWSLLTANEDNPRGNPPVALYDRRVDRQETNDLSGAEDVRTQSTLAAYQRQLAEAQAASAVGAAERETATSSAADCEKLRALGYVSGDCNEGE